MLNVTINPDLVILPFMGLRQMKILPVISIQLPFFWKEKTSRDGKSMPPSSGSVFDVVEGLIL